MITSTAFEKFRRSYQPRYPKSLRNLSNTEAQPIEVMDSGLDAQQKETIKKLFKATYGQPALKMVASEFKKQDQALTIGVVLSGGPAPGGHNVICGICDGLFSVNASSRVIGFLGGASGILNDENIDLNLDIIERYRNTGGFDLLGSGRTKIETPEQCERCQKVLETHGVDVLVIIGGDDSNTNAALLAEYFKEKDSKVRVLGVPKTIDGDLKNDYVEISFGFYTATRLYAELIGNIGRDALSTRKYYHFIRLMGRSASRLTLEVALLTRPNITLISEEIQNMKKTLAEVIDEMVKVIVDRSDKGYDFGLVLIPEGLIEFIPEMKLLIQELNKTLGENKEYFDTLSSFSERTEYANRHLSKDASYVFSNLPVDIQRQLLMDRDPHGNVQVSKIETEKLLIDLIEAKLKELKAKGRYKGKFSYQTHFLGYEGRCVAPTNFDADYTYSLGLNVVALALSGVTGYMSVIKNLVKTNRDEWEAYGIPLSSMMNMEVRNGKEVPVIKKSLVSLEEKPFQELLRCRSNWAVNNVYRFAEPIQYLGDGSVCDSVSPTLLLENDLLIE